MRPISEMSYHPTAEQLVQVLRDKTQSEDALFFRIMVGYYFCLAASQMRCHIKTPDQGNVPVNMFAMNLAPSGYGKNISMNFMELEVLQQFRHRFLEETFPLQAEVNIPKLSLKRSNRKGSDPDDELKRTEREFSSCGPMLFSFDSGTSPAVKQMRHKLLMAQAGSMNLIMDEFGANLSSNQEVFDLFIELFDKGLTKQKLVKNSSDNSRNEEIVGQVPTNLLLFGVPGRLLDGAKTEDDLISMLQMGYARRCFFGYVRSSSRRRKRTAKEIYEDRTSTANEALIATLADRLESLADLVNANKALVISEETCIKLNEYQIYCEERADKLPEHKEMQKAEIANRFFKVLKLAGAYAFIDDSPEVHWHHIENAIKLAEDSGEAFSQLLSRDKPWVKLAKYIAAVAEDVTQADLAEDLPFYKGSASYKQELLTLATAYGYKNNIIIKKAFADGIEFLRGETLKATDLGRLIVAYSTDITEGYRNERAPFDQLHKLTNTAGLHWVTHHLLNGYRNEENCQVGFNLLVIDVDGGTKMETVRTLLKNYTYLMYTTKRHTDEDHRFRLIFPMSHELNLDARDYKEFMNNVYEWLPFEVDTQTNQRSRKWLSHDGHYEYNDGDLLDVLGFIPKTSKNEERKKLFNSQQSLDNLERWVINNTGDGNRNNMLLRYAMVLVDSGQDFESIRAKVIGLNNTLPDKLDEAEIMSTIMISVAKAISKR